LKGIKFIDFLFYVAFAVVIVLAAFFDKHYLSYALPGMIISIGIVYFKNVVTINFWYVLSLISMIVCDALIYLDFVENFRSICLLTSVYFISCTLAVRKYLLIRSITMKVFLSIPIIVSSGLIAYLIYAISQLLIEDIREAIPFVVICLICSNTFILVSYLIYKQDRYRTVLNLIVVSCLCIFIVALLPINELYYTNNIFTLLVNIAHVLSLYIFMKFLVEEHPQNAREVEEKFL